MTGISFKGACEHCHQVWIGGGASRTDTPEAKFWPQPSSGHGHHGNRGVDGSDVLPGRHCHYADLFPQCLPPSKQSAA